MFWSCKRSFALLSFFSRTRDQRKDLSQREKAITAHAFLMIMKKETMRMSIVLGKTNSFILWKNPQKGIIRTLKAPSTFKVQSTLQAWPAFNSINKSLYKSKSHLFTMTPLKTLQVNNKMTIPQTLRDWAKLSKKLAISCHCQSKSI